MFLESARRLRSFFGLTDGIVIFGTFFVAVFLRLYHEAIPALAWIPSIPWVQERILFSELGLVFVVSVGVWLFVLGRHHRTAAVGEWRTSTILLSHLKAVLWTGLVVAAFVFTVRMQSTSRLFLGYWLVAGYVTLVLKDLWFRKFAAKIWEAPTAGIRVLVVGGGPAVSWFVESARGIARHAGSVGALLVEPNESHVVTDVPILGDESDLEEVLEKHFVESAFVVAGSKDQAQLAEITETLIQHGIMVSVVPLPMAGPEGVCGRVTEFGGIPMISWGRMPRDPVLQVSKRALDVGLVALIALPALVAVGLIALSIKLFDKGPVFFSQKRLGKRGRPFQMYKFRTMQVGAEETLLADSEMMKRFVENGYKLDADEDPRITGLGRFLRLASLDELPQIWNVVKGEMTFVGPRPIMPMEIDKLEPYADLFFSVTPGITGNWQINGRSELPYPGRVFLDLDYVGNHSSMRDLEIIAKTLPAVMSRRGAG